MTAETALVQTFRVGRFEAEVTIRRIESGNVGHVVVEWTPRVPDFKRDFTAGERVEYRQRLMAAIAEAPT